MSIQSLTDEILKRLDKSFEDSANRLYDEVRGDDKRSKSIAGRMDGLHEAASIVKEVHNLFVKQDEDKAEDESKPLY